MTITLPNALEGAFLTPEDHAAFVRVRDGALGGPIDVRPLAMGARPVRVRSADDAALLERVLVGGDHLLPIALDRHESEPTVAHLGCGPGYLLARLAYQHPSARLIGVEPSAEWAHAARFNMSTFGDRITIVNASMGVASRRCGVPGDAIMHNLESLLDDCGVTIADAIIAVPEASAAIMAARPETLQRIGQARVRCKDAESASACRGALEAADLVCSADQWHPHGVLAWARSLAALRARFPQPQEVIDPGPGLW
ncbi:MAG: class I SAM-dependent methyltransferase [Phycisphaerales bacterium]|nr:class I SAM-dependent methyltransferase [Phycisphaerales bacterium]